MYILDHLATVACSCSRPILYILLLLNGPGPIRKYAIVFDILCGCVCFVSRRLHNARSDTADGGATIYCDVPILYNNIYIYIVRGWWDTEAAAVSHSTTVEWCEPGGGFPTGRVRGLRRCFYHPAMFVFQCVYYAKSRKITTRPTISDAAIVSRDGVVMYI